MVRKVGPTTNPASKRSNKQNFAAVATGMLVGLCLAVGIIAVNEQEPTAYDHPPVSAAQTSGTATG